MQTMIPRRLERFFSRLGEAADRVLLLDYDGTIAPFHVDPALALPYPEVCELLRGIVAAPRSRVVIVSGRRFEDLEDALARLPHNEAWAAHGWERLIDGQFARRIPSAEAREELDRAHARAQRYTVFGARVETKIASVAVHWRGLPLTRIGRIKTRLSHDWTTLARDELRLLPFDGGLEIRARGYDKGRAVRDTLARHEGAVCAYLGDDYTDEDAFRAIRGRGLPVLVRREPRRTEAELWLRGADALIPFLDRWRRSVTA